MRVGLQTLLPSLYLPSRSKLWCTLQPAPAESSDTLPLYLLYLHICNLWCEGSLPAPLAAASVTLPAFVLALVEPLESAFVRRRLSVSPKAGQRARGRVNRFRFNVGRLYRRRPVVGIDDFTSNGALLSGEPQIV